MISDDYLFSDVGIDSIGFHAPRHFVSLKELAVERNVDPAKYSKGLLSKEMRVAEADEDIISLGLKAGYNAYFEVGLILKVLMDYLWELKRKYMLRRVYRIFLLRC